MNILQRLRLLWKGQINAALDALEDPERSLLQLVRDMEEELDAAKHAVARAMANGGVLSSAHAHNLHVEFERISGRVEEEAATERNYQRLDDQLSGADVRRRFEADAVADAVEERLARLRKPREAGAAAGAEAP